MKTCQGVHHVKKNSSCACGRYVETADGVIKAPLPTGTAALGVKAEIEAWDPKSEREP